MWLTGLSQCRKIWISHKDLKTASYFSFLLSYVSSSSVSLLFLFPFHRLSQSSDEYKQEHSLHLKLEERHYYDFSLKGHVEPQA